MFLTFYSLLISFHFFVARWCPRCIDLSEEPDASSVTATAHAHPPRSPASPSGGFPDKITKTSQKLAKPTGKQQKRSKT